ncbi:phosphatidylinositol diacylglycerol-lyase [Lentinula edodes]|uniref:Phosphatidylinositol diacylglycerol-lyase n=1 Tax=Lentinula edodes TaxID=5353 RepID=A0A1Q3ED62_LENED|nr:phosphatidylinositol diacylglycerol-lyase [Lentinula edodes]
MFMNSDQPSFSSTFWSAPKSNIMLSGSSSFDSTVAQWTGPTQMTDAVSNTALLCNQAPAICDIGGQLQVVFRAQNNLLHYTYDDISGNWIQQSWPTSPSALSGAALVVYQGKMYCAVRGDNSYITWAFWTPPTVSTPGTWSGNFVDGDTTGDIPALFVTLDSNNVETLNLLWGAKNSSGTVLQKTFNPALAWHWYQPASPPAPQKEATGGGVTASTGEYGSYMAFREHGEHAVLISFYQGGVWHASEHTEQAATGNPAVVAFQDSIYCIFASTGTPSLLLVSRSATAIHPSYWMSTLDDTKSIAQYTIPGTHDSAAGTISAQIGNPFGGARTQTLDIFHQLSNGIRFIDTRLDIFLGTLQCFHGILPLGITFSAVLSQIYKFLQLHPSETVIISVKREGSATDSDLWAEVAAAIEPGSEFWWNYSTQSGGPGYTGLPTLRDSRGKIILLRRSEYGFPFGIPVPSWPNNNPHAVVSLPRNSAGILEQLEFQDQYVADPNYSLSRDLDVKKTIFNDFLQYQISVSRTNWLGRDLLLNFTNAASRDVLSDKKGYTPRQLAAGDGNEGINEYVLNLFQSSSLPPPGIGSIPGVIPMDFPEYPRNELIAAIYMRNFS